MANALKVSTEDMTEQTRSACGFDSIPNDLGHVVLAQSMEGDVNSVESFIKIILPATLGTKLNYGTWHSAIVMFHNYGEIEELHRKLAEGKGGNLIDILDGLNPSLNPSLSHFSIQCLPKRVLNLVLNPSLKF